VLEAESKSGVGKDENMILLVLGIFSSLSVGKQNIMSTESSARGRKATLPSGSIALEVLGKSRAFSCLCQGRGTAAVYLVVVAKLIANQSTYNPELVTRLGMEEAVTAFPAIANHLRLSLPPSSPLLHDV